MLDWRPDMLCCSKNESSSHAARLLAIACELVVVPCNEVLVQCNGLSFARFLV